MEPKSPPKKRKKTERQQQAQVRKWQLASNDTRRAKYADDPDYRKEVKAKSREAARASKGIESGKRVALVRQGIDELDETATVRTMLGESLEDMQEKPCLTSGELSDALGLSHRASFTRWQRRGIFPKPQQMARIGKKNDYVYTMEAARELLLIMIEHYHEKNYFGVADRDTIDALFLVFGMQSEANKPK